MKNKSIERQVEALKFDITRYAKKARDRRKTHQALLKDFHPRQIKPMMKLLKAQKDMGITDGDLANLARCNLLPEKIQALYESVINPPIQRDGDGEHISSPLRPQNARWNLKTWQCSCGCSHMQWFPTHLELKDHYQVYCSSCYELAGWGSERDFKWAQSAERADLITLKSSFDRYEYHPPLLMKPVDHPPRRRIRTKRSQSDEG